MEDMSRPLTPEERTIGFERWWNVRDLGGIPTGSGTVTRSGIVVRATTPEYATRADVARARDLGLTTFVDLRSPRDPPRWLADSPEVRRRVVNVVGSVKTGRETAEEVLTFILDGGRREVGEAIRAILDLAEEATPVVVHCHTGKDRTGMIVILLLLLAGVPKEAIMEDYLASNRGFEEMRATIDPEGHPLFAHNAPAAVRGPVVAAGAEAALRFLEEAGGVRRYLGSTGLTTEEIDRAAGLLAGD
jgi:hypothetical protein